MCQLSFKRHCFPPDIIGHSIWFYAGFTLGFPDVEEMLAERGLVVSYETVRRRFLKLGTIVTASLCRAGPRPCDHRDLDEMVIVIRGKRFLSWRAVDNEGEVLECLVQRKRDAKAAKKLLKKQGFEPTRIVADRLRSYPSAFRTVDLAAEHDRGLRACNRAETSLQAVRRRERKQQECKSPGSAQRFLSVHAATDKTYDSPRHLLKGSTHKELRAASFDDWQDASLAV